MEAALLVRARAISAIAKTNFFMGLDFVISTV
jgi:hypothetical protein